jgi:23S rRNA (guanosine2251-2'-O)-methyltransferase
MRKLSMEELGRKTVKTFRESEKIPVTVILDNVRSMHNVGSIFRTADAFLIEKIWLCGYTPQPPHRDINKTALGATETVAWEYAPDAFDVVELLKARGFYIAAVEQAEGSTNLSDFLLPDNQPLAVVFGNEVEGVQDSILAISNAAIEIPQMGMKHSLNVSVAAGIVLFRLAELSVKSAT